jgi:branched-chain amino acid transport system substrate-binding protein
VIRETFKVLLILIVIVITGCAKDKTDSLKIGAILPLTGPAAQMGQEMQRGQLLAKEYWNNNNVKYKTARVELLIEDSKSSPKDALSSYMKLRSQDVSIFTANLSSVCLALLPKVDEDNILLFADAAHPAITQKPNPKVFRNSSTSEVEAQEISKSLLKKDIKKISVLYINDEYGIAFLKELHRILEPKASLSDIAFDANTSDYRPLALKAQQVKPDAVIIVGIGKSIGMLIQTLRTQGFKGDIYANIGYLLTGGREAAGNARRGVYFTKMRVPVTEAGKWAEKEYKKRFGKQIPAEALLEFNSISLIVLASVDTKMTALEVSHNMRNAVIKLFGEDRLNAKGDILPDMEVLVDDDN